MLWQYFGQDAERFNAVLSTYNFLPRSRGLRLFGPEALEALCTIKKARVVYSGYSGRIPVFYFGNCGFFKTAHTWKLECITQV